jgi:hypothetical protein
VEEKLDGLSDEEIGEVRDYEKRNKDRESLRGAIGPQTLKFSPLSRRVLTSSMLEGGWSLGRLYRRSERQDVWRTGA